MIKGVALLGLGWRVCKTGQWVRQMAACLTQQCLLKLRCSWWLSVNSIYPVPTHLEVVLQHYLKLPSVKVQEGHFCLLSSSCCALQTIYRESSSFSFPSKHTHPLLLESQFYSPLENTQRSFSLKITTVTEIRKGTLYELLLSSRNHNVRYQINILQWGCMLPTNCNPC